jgi:hypothetical protein
MSGAGCLGLGWCPLTHTHNLVVIPEWPQAYGRPALTVPHPLREKMRNRPWLWVQSRSERVWVVAGRGATCNAALHHYI